MLGINSKTDRRPQMAMHGRVSCEVGCKRSHGKPVSSVANWLSSGVLQRARPQWSTKDLAAAEAKLLSIGICTAEKLAEQLAASVLNDNLRSGGFRAFAAETLQALREASSSFRCRRGVHPTQAVPESETVD
eukprot:g21308.t1